MTSNRQKAFSMVELLVVIAILAVILGLLLPVFSQVRQRARGAQCVVKLKHLWTCWDHYRREKQGLLYNGSNAWLYEMADSRSLVSGDETVCPAATDQSTGAYFYPNPYSGKIGKVTYWSGPPAKPIGYTINNWVFYASAEFTSARTFTKLAATPLFFDGMVYGLASSAWNDLDLRVKRFSFRHHGRANVLFLDGHVESLDPDMVKRLNPKPN